MYYGVKENTCKKFIQTKNKKNDEHLKKPTEKKLKVKDFVEFMSDKNLKIERFKECGNFIKFLTNKEKTHFSLSGGTFCNNRFCPVCSWLKARKWAFELLELMECVRVKEKKEFIFLTLTAPNVKSSELSKEITDYNKSFKRLMELEDVETAVKGYIRKLEVTYNAEADTYHPHLHVILAVNRSYFTDRTYIKKEKWLELWKKSKRDESITQVDIRKVKMGTLKEIFEIATYSTKHKDLFHSKEVFDVFYRALKSRQLITFGGLFKDYRKLQLEGTLDTSETDLEGIKEVVNTELGYNWSLEEYREIFERFLSQDELKEIYNIEIENELV